MLDPSVDAPLVTIKLVQASATAYPAAITIANNAIRKFISNSVLDSFCKFTKISTSGKKNLHRSRRLLGYRLATEPHRERGRRLAAVGLLLEEAFELATHGAVALAQRGEVVGYVGDVVGGDC